jgi:error-prone DNA polymerase
MRKAGFVELCARTHYSLLQGASSPREMVERARELGCPAIGIADRNGVYGVPKAFEAWKSLESTGFKLIVGAELTLDLADADQAPEASTGAAGRRTRPEKKTRRLWHLRLLAINRPGYGLMCRLITESHAGKPKGDCWLRWSGLLRMTHEAPGIDGLIAIPTPGERDLSHWPLDRLRDLKAIFDQRFYLPVSRFLDGWDQQRVRVAVGLSRELGIPLVATNEAHAHMPERRVLQDLLTATRENVPLDEAGSRLFSNAERHLKPPEEMEALLGDLPEALEATIAIAERCTFSPKELRYRYPSEWIPRGETAQSYLTQLAEKGVRWRYPEGEPEKVRKQLEHELKLIDLLGFADYFLTIWEIVEFAKSRNILCQGRGSAANSLVCFCLGITAIGPETIHLLFERFISAERGEPPDIDVDFEHERREEVIQHIYEKYGRDRAGMVAAVITYRDRSSRRDALRALGYNPDKLPPEAEPISVKDPRVEPLAAQIEGLPRHLSIHSGGFTLSADPIIETVPIEPARMEGRTIVQWDKDDLAAIGLLKVDVLALGMLTALHRTFDCVNATRARSGEAALTIATTPQDDPKTYAMIQAADTIGVFQIESRAQMNMLGRLKPETFYDLVIEVAIVRPGPIQGGMIHPYLRRRRGLEPIEFPHPGLKEILGRTLGVPLFQEQVMAMAKELAGFTPGEADQLRRAVNAWKSKGSIEKMGRRLMDGLLKSGLTQEYVERIFQQIQGFAEYGFPESHAASFALLAYVSSYLKCHYPAEFTCALINSQPMGFYSTHSLVEDALRHGVEVRPLDPNLSEWDCTLEDASGPAPAHGRAQAPLARARPGSPAVRVGWRVVRGLGEDAARAVLDERAKRPFASLPDFLTRTRLKPSVLHELAMADAFEIFGLKQRDALWEILGHTALSLFAQGQETQPGLFEPLTKLEAIQSDHQSNGLSVRGHAMAVLREALGPEASSLATTGRARLAPSGRRLRLAGQVIARQRPPTAKGTVFATLEDEEGVLDLVLHKDVAEKYARAFEDSRFLIASGKMQKDGGTVTLIVESVTAIEAAFRSYSHDFR